MKTTKVFIFESVFSDYTDGLAVGVAVSKSAAALEVIKEYYGDSVIFAGKTVKEMKESNMYSELMSADVKVIDAAKGETGAAYVYGGC